MADPVAPQPMMATLARLNFCCPPNPIPENKTCREYLSSSSKEVTRFRRLNLYYRGIRNRVRAGADIRARAEVRRGVALRSGERQHC